MIYTIVSRYDKKRILFSTEAESLKLVLRGADLWRADLRGADLDFSCLPLWCGSVDIKIDEKLAKQFLAHAFNASKEFCQPTEEQKEFINSFHRILSGEFPKFE